MKTTVISYCQVCSKDFKNNEIVYYVSIDNSIVCSKCADKASELTEDIQPRVFER